MNEAYLTSNWMSCVFNRCDCAVCLVSGASIKKQSPCEQPDQKQRQTTSAPFQHHPRFDANNMLLPALLLNRSCELESLRQLAKQGMVPVPQVSWRGAWCIMAAAENLVLP
jgi:hypothetical protein